MTSSDVLDTCYNIQLVQSGNILLKDIEGITDSKRLTSKKREELFELILKNSIYHIVWKWPQEIDEKGLSLCIKEALIEIKNSIESKNIFLMVIQILESRKLSQL